MILHDLKENEIFSPRGFTSNNLKPKKSKKMMKSITNNALRDQELTKKDRLLNRLQAKLAARLSPTKK
jgi:hypothetical protein